MSHATAWEVAVKTGLGKMSLAVPYDQLFPGELMANGFLVLAPDLRHYRELLTLPFHHRDPFDRLLIDWTFGASCPKGKMPAQRLRAARASW